MKYTLDHCAFTVPDLQWMIDFFNKAFDWTVTRSKDSPVKQVWFDDVGIQLIEAPGAAGIAHIGISTGDLDATLEKIKGICPYVTLEKKGRNWIEIPNKLILEFMVK